MLHLGPLFHSFLHWNTIAILIQVIFSEIDLNFHQLNQRVATRTGGNIFDCPNIYCTQNVLILLLNHDSTKSKNKFINQNKLEKMGKYLFNSQAVSCHFLD